MSDKCDGIFLDPMIEAAALALARGDPLGALKRVALRDDAQALALRGTAMAQLGDLPKARSLLRRAAGLFGSQEIVARARCIVAEAEVALASRDLGWPEKLLDGARNTLEAHGDRVNAAHARSIEVRRMLLIGRVEDAERAVSNMDPASLSPQLRTVHELVVAGIALRRMHIAAASAALDRAKRAAFRARIPALAAEVESAHRLLTIPAARLVSRGAEQLLLPQEVEELFASRTLVIDACHNAVRIGQVVIPLAKRAVLFGLARVLGEGWPEDVSREVLLARAFGARHADDSHRARLRVEVGRLRKALHAVADVTASKRGFVLTPRAGRNVVVLTLPVEDEHAALLALLSDGESWSSSALATALGTGPRTIQRALGSLAAEGKVQGIGRGRAQRWMVPPIPAFVNTLLLPAFIPTQ